MKANIHKKFKKNYLKVVMNKDFIMKHFKSSFANMSMIFEEDFFSFNYGKFEKKGKLAFLCGKSGPDIVGLYDLNDNIIQTKSIETKTSNGKLDFNQIEDNNWKKAIELGSEMLMEGGYKIMKQELISFYLRGYLTETEMKELGIENIYLTLKEFVRI